MYLSNDGEYLNIINRKPNEYQPYDEIVIPEKKTATNNKRSSGTGSMISS
jgi:hypothetical protein